MYQSFVHKIMFQDEEMSYMDKCSLHLAVKRKDRTETLTFQVSDPLTHTKLYRIKVQRQNYLYFTEIIRANQNRVKVVWYVLT